MGSVKRLRDKVYRIVYDVPGTNGKRKQKRETLDNVTKSEAEEVLAKQKEWASTPRRFGIPTSPSSSCLTSSFESRGGRCLHRLANATKDFSATTSRRLWVTPR